MDEYSVSVILAMGTINACGIVYIIKSVIDILGKIISFVNSLTKEMQDKA